MKVICQIRYPSEEQNIALGYNKENTTGYELTVGQEYTVLGVSFQAAASVNKGVVLLLRDDIGRCAFVPICMLDISNPSASKSWIARISGECDFCLWPEEFFLKYFHDDLSNGVQSAVEIFDFVCQALDQEHTSEE